MSSAFTSLKFGCKSLRRDLSSISSDFERDMWAKVPISVLVVWVIVCAFPVHGSAGEANSPTVSPSFSSKIHGLVAAPPKMAYVPSSPLSHSLGKAPPTHGFRSPSSATPKPSRSPFEHTTRARTNAFAYSPANSYSNHHHHHDVKNQRSKSAAGPSYLFHPQPHGQQAMGPAFAASSAPSMAAPSPTFWQMPVYQPYVSPLSSSVKTPPPSATLALPPPPPNQDCTTITCTEPLTYTPSGFPCGCVCPFQVRLCLHIPLYTFFPLVSKLAVDIASSLLLKQGQVRVMGANAANEQLEKTIVLVNLVPLGEKFEYGAVFSAYNKFWHKQVHINSSLFGAYDVLDVHYPGLPPSPPTIASNLATIDDHPYPANFKEHHGSVLKPLGVDVPRRQKDKLGGSTLAVIIVSSITAVVICAGIAWILIARCSCSAPSPEAALSTSMSSFTKPSGAARSLALGNRSLSESLSFGSGALTFSGSAKIYSLDDMERATNKFDTSRVLGEGGFGVVYRGILDDGEQVAVKVLKRESRHGVREFLSEVEMLSRLHHRNLVKLLGICTEDHIRCLVYELVPNGSVESHLHGVNKEVTPLDWATRMKIALGAARGLAYLHEDSNPCVIHRDFKSSNILLEHDFTPKVSDFGLARNALKEGNHHISTHVIGTFGYLAPEYAMTGHLLVKSDVYSYGVVLLELLTGRKPVDFSKPPGQENLGAWAHPLLTSKEGLETVIDPTLKSIAPFESFSKVAAIASMCVQPEVSRRPFMGEVVQALKLVYSEFVDVKEEAPRRSFDQAEVSLDDEYNSKSCQVSGEFRGLGLFEARYSMVGYEPSCDAKIALSTMDLSSASEFKEKEYPSLRRQYSSGSLEMGRKRHFWLRLGRFSNRSMRERLWPGSP